VYKIAASIAQLANCILLRAYSCTAASAARVQIKTSLLMKHEEQLS